MNAIDEHTSYGILALYGPSGAGSHLESAGFANVRAKKSTDPAEWLEMRDAVSYALDLWQR